MSNTSQPRDPLGQFAGLPHRESEVQLVDDEATNAATEELLNSTADAFAEFHRVAARSEKMAAKSVATIVRATYPDARYIEFESSDQGGSSLVPWRVLDAANMQIEVGDEDELGDLGEDGNELWHLAGFMTDSDGPGHWREFEMESTDNGRRRPMVMDIELALAWDHTQETS